MVQILAKSIKPFRIYSKMKYFTFDFDFGVKVIQLCFLFNFIWLFAIFSKSDRAVQDLLQNEIFDL